MYSRPDPRLWHGRVDTADGAGGKRWHEEIGFLSYPYHGEKGIALLGFACDEGVRRNQGRVGAAKGPDVLKQAMGGFACHLEKRLYDCGTVSVAERNLEEAQKMLAKHVETLLGQGHFPIILGGGHEMALGTFLGAYHYFQEEIAILNFDAHFDLRKNHEASSGTPFAQIASLSDSFHYLCLGISEAANTKALFAEADALGAAYMLDTEMHYHYLPQIRAKLDIFLAQRSHIYISIDSDVFPACQVPAVSAMSGRGVEVGLVYEVLHYLFSDYGDKIRLIDIAEFNPRYDLQGIGQKTVARLVYDIAAMASKYKHY